MALLPSLCGEQSLNVGPQCLWNRNGRVAVNDATLAVDKKLFKVPLDALQPEDALSLTLQKAVNWVGIWAIYINLVIVSLVRVSSHLLHDGERNTIVDLAHLNFLRAPWLLLQELVTCYDDQLPLMHWDVVRNPSTTKPSRR